MADELLTAAFKKADGEILRAIEEMIASVTAKKYRDMDESVERAIVECGQGLGRSVSEARA